MWWAEATREQFACCAPIWIPAIPGGGMSDMGLFDYVAMVEETPVNTHIVEYRKDDGTLLACALTDRLRDGLSMVYSFFHPARKGAAWAPI
jgi:arginine-tRNA-protein transferase